MAKKLCVLKGSITAGVEISKTAPDRYKYTAEAHTDRTDEHPWSSKGSVELISDDNLAIGQAVTITVEVV